MPGKKRSSSYSHLSAFAIHIIYWTNTEECMP